MPSIDRRMADAAEAEEQGQYREAARLYSQLGTDIQATQGASIPVRSTPSREWPARSARAPKAPDDVGLTASRSTLPATRRTPMLKQFRATQRHTRLMRIASHLVLGREEDAPPQTSSSLSPSVAISSTSPKTKHSTTSTPVSSATDGSPARPQPTA
ncbi:hypothetical protein NKH18_01275 [Streptomyces sp. M10(2022)]